MKRTAKRCLSILMIYAMITGGVRAQDESSGSARVSDQPGPLPSEPTPVFAEMAGPPSAYFPMTPVERWFAPRFYVDARGGTLYGYEESFTSLGGFVPYFYEENSMLFVDGRGMVGYDGRGGANLGVGMRHYVPGWDRFFGLNAWYDFDASHQRSYNQFGMGFESIGRYFDMIVNGYIPVGQDFNNISSYYGGNTTFSGNQLLLDRFNQTETAYTGFDIQVGGPMPLLGRYGLQGYTGFYFFTGSNNGDFTGVSGRLAWQLNEDVNLAVNMTDDHTFGTNTQIQVSLSLPDGKPSRWLRPLSVRDRMMQSTLRNYRVTVEQEVQLVQEAAINPKDNQPYFVVHIDPNTAGVDVPAGDGTVENPYNLISQFDNLALNNKSPVDIIYVRPRADDTTTNLDTGVTLLTGQRLLSTSVPHLFTTAQSPGQEFNLPGFAYNPTGEVLELPVLTNRNGGNVVTFADGAYHVEVSGFEINSGAGASGIVGMNNRGVRINRNVIQGVAGGTRTLTSVTGGTYEIGLADPADREGLNGIALTNLTGLAADGAASIIDSNIIRNHVVDGINISNTGVAALDLQISNNAPTDVDRDGIAEVDAPGLDENDIDTNNNGVIDPNEMLANNPAADSLDGDGDFTNDGIANNGDDGIDINADAGSVINLVIRNNGEVAIDDGTPLLTGDGNLQFDTNGDGLPDTVTSTGLVDSTGSVLGRVDEFGVRQPVRGGIFLNGGNGIELDATANSFIGGIIVQNVIGGGATVANNAGTIIDAVSFGNGANGILMRADNSTLDFLSNGREIRANVISANGAFVPDGFVPALPNLVPVVNAGSGIRVDATNSETLLRVMGNAIGSPLNTATLGEGATFDPRFGNAEYGLVLNQTGGEALVLIGDNDIPPDPTNPLDDGTLNRNLFRYNEIGGISLNTGGNGLLSFNIENNEVLNNYQARANGFSTNLLLTFNVVGNTEAADFTYAFANNSDSGNLLTGFQWILPAVSPGTLVFDTVAPTAPSQPFQPVGSGTLTSDVTTGLTTVNGTTITPGTNPLQDAGGVVLVDGGVPDNQGTMTLVFNGNASTGQTFNSGETFQFDIDIDAVNAPATPVTGDDLVGSTVNATFFVPQLNRTVNQTILMSALGGNGAQANTTLTVGIEPVEGRGVGQNGISVNTSGTATANQGVIQNNDVSGYGESGISVVSSDLSQINNLLIDNNRVTFNGIEPDVVNTLNRTPTGAGIRLERQDSSLLRALVTNNITGNLDPATNPTGNFGDGMNLVSNGTALGGLFVRSNDNVFTDNSGAGVRAQAFGNSTLTWESENDVIDDNGRIVSRLDGTTTPFVSDNVVLQSDDDANLVVNFTQLSADGNVSGSGLSVSASGTSLLTLDIDSDLDTANPTTFQNNAQNGLEVSSLENALVLVNVDQTRFVNNGGDGANFNRAGSSLLLVDIANSTFSGNDDDGLQFYASGTDRQDPNTPLFNGTDAPASRLRLVGSVVSNNGVAPVLNPDGTLVTPGTSPNGGNGLEFATEADAIFVSKVISTSITNNATDGARIFATGISSYGEALDRSEFDNVTITGNLRDGIKLFAMGQLGSTPDMFVDVNSNSGNTLISDNGDDGIQASVPYGSIDLNVEGTNGTLRIQRNGFIGNTPTGGGNGIEFNVADTAIDGDDAGDTLASNNGERTDADWDGSANEILNFFFPEGFEFTGVDGYNGFGTLNVSNAIIGDDNLNDAVALGNANDGIQIFNSNVWNFIGGGNDGTGGGATFVGPTTDALGNALVAGSAANDHDVNRDLIVDGAFGAGNVSRDFIVDQAGIMTFTMDNTIVGGNRRDGLNIISDGNNGAFDPGNLVAAIVTDSTFVSNGRHGVNIDLEGKHGEYAIGFGPGGTYTVTSANQFIFDNNVIARNNNYGFRYQANAGVIQRPNFGVLPDTYFWSEQFQDGVQPTNPPGSFSTTYIRDNTLISAIFNTSGNTPGITSGYYSIATDLNSRLTFTNNDVRNNGRLNQGFNEGGDGLFIRVSTNSYLSADIGGAAGSGNGNTFSGNALADVRFESFTASWVNGLTYAVPNVSTAGTTTTLDQLFLDDTAQMTLRFNNNIGREMNADQIIRIGALGQRTAGYDANGTAFIGNLSGIRTTQMFQVDDAANLDTNNTWVSDLDTEFNAASWYLVPVADPAFPNPIFPENINEDFGDPYFPF